MTAAPDATTDVDAGIPPASPAVQQGPTVVADLPLELLVDNPRNPRIDLGDLTTLADSIRSVGLLEPLVVVPAEVYRAGIADPTVEMDDGRYVLIAGHRRKGACQLAGLTEIPCVIRQDLTGTQARMAMLLENLERSNLTVLEEAQAYAELVDLDLTQEEIGRRVGRSQAHISKRLDLLKLPVEGQQLLLDKAITLDEARALVPLADKPKELAAAVARKSGYGGIKAAVDEVLKKESDAQAYADTMATLKAKGVRAIKAPQYYANGVRYDESYDKGKPARVEDLVAAKRVKTKAAHRKLPCHAVAVVATSGYSSKAGSTEDVCTSWDTHPLPVDQGKAARAVEEASYAAALQLHRAAEQDHLHQLLRDKKPSKDLSAYALLAAVDRATAVGYGSRNREVAEALGLDTAPLVTEGDARSSLLDLAYGSSAGLMRVLAGCMLDQDRRVNTHGDPLASHRAPVVRKLLTDTGYTAPGPEPVPPGQKSAPPAEFAIDDRVTLLDPDHEGQRLVGTVVGTEWLEDENAWVFLVAMDGESRDYPDSAYADELTRCTEPAAADAGPLEPADTTADPTTRCAACGCTLDGPCGEKGHCEDEEGFPTCELMEGQSQCSRCGPPGVVDVEVAEEVL